MINSGDINSEGAVKFSKYSEFVHNYNSNYNVFPLLGFNGISMASFFDGYSLGGNMRLLSYWGNGFPSIYAITSMIQNDFPVIMSVGPSYTNNNSVTLYSELKLSDRNKNDTPKTTVDGHYMTITGVIFDHYNDKTWLKVSSWGSCYYIDFDEYILYTKQNYGVSGVMNNILHIIQL